MGISDFQDSRTIVHFCKSNWWVGRIQVRLWTSVGVSQWLGAGKTEILSKLHLNVPSKCNNTSSSLSLQFQFCNNGLNKERKLLSVKKIIGLWNSTWKNWFFLFFHVLRGFAQRESKCHGDSSGGVCCQRLIAVLHLCNTHPWYALSLQPANQGSGTR